MARRNPDKQPSAAAEKLAELLADQQLDLDELSSEYLESVNTIQTDLLTNANDRNEAIWLSAGADVTLTLSDFAEIPVAERDDNWALQFQSIISASYMQAVADSGFLADLVIISDNHASALINTSKKVTNSDLREIASEGVLNGKLDDRRAVRG